MAAAIERNLLDLPERRFPINLNVEIPKVRDMYHAATRNQWDPQTDVDWSALDDLDITDEQRQAAILWWSRRAWNEYGAVSESPSLLVRFYQERFEPDLAFFFTIRTQEEARHAEASWMMAERLGGYVPEPRKQEYQGSISTHGVRKMAFDLDSSIEAVVAALVCGLEEYAFDWFRLMGETTTNKAARQVIRLITRDEVRHCAFGWAFMQKRIPTLSASQKKVVEEAIFNATQHVELNGYRVPWLAPEGEASRQEMETDRICYEAGLGGTTEEVEKPVFVATVKRVREQFAAMGLTVPAFHHHRIGAL